MRKIVLVSLLFVLSFFQLLNAAPKLEQHVVEYLIPKLNSDRIAYFFGNYGVEPIPIPSSPFGECRIANLYSVHNEQKIMRTLAVVDFHQPVNECLKQVHKEICEGQSIGIALRQNGWKMDKVPLYFGSVDLSPQVQKWMHEFDSNRAAVHVYKLDVFKNESDARLHYCTIIEVHSPQYLSEEWLQALYKDQYDNYINGSEEIDALMCSLNHLILEFPNPSL